MSPLVQVTGTWLGPDDVPCQGRVILELLRPWPNTDPQRAVSTGPVVCDLDDTGSIAADVVASNDDGWPGASIVPYVVTVALDGHRVARYQVAILGPGPVDLTTLTPTCVGDNVAIVPVPGPPGPPNTLIKGTVITGPPGTPADFTLTGEPPEQTLSMTLPQGMPGEVTAAQLAAVTPTLHEGPMPSIFLTRTPEQIRDGWAGIPNGWHYWPTGDSGMATLVLVDRAPESAVPWVRISTWSSLRHRRIWTGPEGGAALTMQTGDIAFHGADPGATFVRKSGLTHTGVILAADAAPGKVLTSDATGVGAWAALPTDDILAPVWAQIGDPALIAPHATLALWDAELGDRVAALEGSPAPTPPALHLLVDRAPDGATRILATAVTATPATADLALATVAGPGGTVIPNLGGIPGSTPVTADMSGVVAPVVTATGLPVLGSTLKEWIRRGDILTLHKDTTTGAPRLMVDLVTAPTPAGSSLKLGDLNNVAPAADSAAAGMLLGTTSTGQWAPVDGAVLRPSNNLSDVASASTALANIGGAPAATVGNLLTANQASIETDATGWALDGALSRERTTADAYHGSASLLITAAANTGWGIRLAGNYKANLPVRPGQVYTVRVMLKAQTGSRPWRTTINWWDSNGVLVGGAGVYGTPVTPVAGGWVLATMTAVAPPTAAYLDFRVMPSAAGVAGDSVVFADCFGVWAGAGGDWGMPGTPIVNQGIRSSAPNGTDSLTEVWDSTKGTWVPIRYTSGARTVTGGKALRDNNMVTWTGTDPAPTGFRDTYQTGGKTYLTGDGIPTTLPGTPG